MKGRKVQRKSRFQAINFVVKKLPRSETLYLEKHYRQEITRKKKRKCKRKFLAVLLKKRTPTKVNNVRFFIWEKAKNFFGKWWHEAIALSLFLMMVGFGLFLGYFKLAKGATLSQAWTSYNDFNFQYGQDSNATTTQSNVTINGSGTPTDADSGTVTINYETPGVVDNADTSANWVSSDGTNFTVSQETTDKQEGTGSVKIVAAVISGFDGGTGADGTLDLSLGSGAGGCNGTGVSWAGATCTIATATKP